jgi:hypothetical protein
MTDLYSNENNRDFLGKNFQVGDLVAKGESVGSSSARAIIAKVTEIRNGKLYLDNSPLPIKFTNRLIILNGKYMYKGDYYSS